MEYGSKTVLKKLWKSKVPSKIKVFGWRLVLNRLPSRVQLFKRGFLHSGMIKHVFCASVKRKVWLTCYINAIFLL